MIDRFNYRSVRENRKNVFLQSFYSYACKEVERFTVKQKSTYTATYKSHKASNTLATQKPCTS